MLSTESEESQILVQLPPGAGPRALRASSSGASVPHLYERGKDHVASWSPLYLDSEGSLDLQDIWPFLFLSWLLKFSARKGLRLQVRAVGPFYGILRFLVGNSPSCPLPACGTQGSGAEAPVGTPRGGLAFLLTSKHHFFMLTISIP